MSKRTLSGNGFETLIVEFLTGSIMPEGLDQLQVLIDENVENKDHFNAIRNTWIASGKPIPSYDLDRRWDKALKMVEQDEMPEISKNERKPWIRRLLPIAASWLLFFASGVGITWLITSRHDEKDPGSVEMSVPLGARSHVRMPDGTGIWLNAGTTITYDGDYGKKTRTIDLSGEAFFDVAKDKPHPFIVHTSEMDVQAVGTRFNVKAYPDEKTISATLEEGKINVEVLGTKNRKPISLNENEKIILLKQTQKTESYTHNAEEKVFENTVNEDPRPSKTKAVSVLSHVNTQLYTSWKGNRWIIQGEELGTLAPMFERRFNIRIVFGSEELKNYKFSGIIENETVDQIMELLSLTAPVEYRIDKDQITLNLNKKNIIEFGKTITRSN